ncbi:MAG: hypothetical protein R2713_16520 [Ilumatobacteraceae bacterium]
MWAIVVREVVVGLTMAIATLAFGMALRRHLLGEAGHVPAHVRGAGFHARRPRRRRMGPAGFLIASWILAVPGLVLSYVTAALYVPKIRAGIAAGRAGRAARNEASTPHGGTR